MEGNLARLLKSHLQPVEIAKRLSKAMEADQRVSVGKVLVPNIYEIHLNPKDFELFHNYATSLEREFSSYLVSLAKERKFSLTNRPHIRFISDESTPQRKVQIAARFADEASGTTGQVEDGNALSGMTTKLAPRQDRQKVALKAKLVRSGIGGKNDEFNVSKLPFNIGRALDNDLILEDSGVSRYHAQIREVFDHLCLIDMKSTNGSRVNGEAFTQVILRDGDCLTFAGATLIFRIQTNP